MKIAIYPGTFDPITYGHIDVIKKSLNIFDKLIVATTDNINKNYHFSIDDRLNIINNSLFKDLKLNKKRIKVIPFDTFTIGVTILPINTFFRRLGHPASIKLMSNALM